MWALMLSDPLLGRVIDNKYRIDAEIGAGGMATIYRATRLQIGDTVAIKVLHAEFLRDPKFTERFQREAQAAARLKHPNAVTIHDFGVSEDGIIYLVMELVEGQNLRTIIKEEGPMTTAAAAVIVRQVCAALTEAHRQNIVHRDIKPANIAVTTSPDGIRVKVLDFGIASLRGGGMMTLTQAGDLMGTPAYMSPEQCLGEELDSRSDIYSLGIVLFEMLSGVVPFNSPTVTAVVMQHVQQTPPPLRVLNASVSAPVEAVVLRALAKRREDRSQSAREFADELSSAVAGVAAPLHTDDARIVATHPFSSSQVAQTMIQSPMGAAAHSVPPPRSGRRTGILISVAAAIVLAAVWVGAQQVALQGTNHVRARTAQGSSAPTRLTSAPGPAQTFAFSSPASVDFVNQYYRLWNAADYRTMYGMLSARMQLKNPYDQYVKYHSLVTRIDVGATNGAAASIVNVRIVSHDREKDGSITQTVNEGEWYLTTENGQLKMDAQNAHEVKSAEVVVAPPATAIVAVSPVNFVQEYYRLWNAADYRTMYGMLSTRMQQKNPYEQYVKYHSLVTRIAVEASPGYAPSVVNVRIISQDREKDGSITQTVNEGQWYLTSEYGQLKLDAQDAHEVK
jgi:serine/threonine protein kinase